MGLCKRVVVLRGGGLEGMDQGLAVRVDDDVAPGYVVVEVTKCLLHGESLPPKGGPLLLVGFKGFGPIPQWGPDSIDLLLQGPPQSHQTRIAGQC